MSRRAWAGGLILGIGLLLLATRAEAVIIRLLPMRNVLGDSTFICTAKVETLDKTNLTMMLLVDEHLKGKGPFQKLPVLLKGDDEAAKGKQTPELLKRLAPKVPLVLFVSQREKEYIAFAYTNGTWFQMLGVKPDDAETVRWSFTHTEPFLRRTFCGTTEEMKKVVTEVLAGKRKPPDANPKEEPGLGPEVKPESKPVGARLKLHQGPVFAVIPSVLIGGPLAVLSMLFPTLFGGWKRWLAMISVVCTTSTLYLLHWWFAARLTGTIWASPLVLWLGLTTVTLLGCCWAWARHVRRIEEGQAPLVPGRLEQGLLVFLTLVGAIALLYGWRSGDKLLTPAWMQVLVICLGAGITALFVTLARLRRQAAPAETTGPSLSRPALASEVVMLTVMTLGSILLAGTQQGRAIAVSSTENAAQGAGKLIWKHEWKVQGSIFSTPLVAGNRVFVAVAHEDTFRPQGAIYCFDAGTGDLKWSTRDTIKNMKLISISSPCLADGRLYIGEGFHEDANCKLYCLNADTGQKVWDFETGSHVESSPVVADGKVYFGAGDDGIYCVDAKTGKEVWHFPGLHVDATPVVHNGRLYVGSGVGDVVKQPAIVCIDVGSGQRLWQHEQKLPVWGSPVLVGDLVYFGLANGRINQSDPTDPQGEVLAVKTETGAEIWRFKARDGVLAQPTADRGRIYFGSRDQHLYCVDRRTGKLCWKLFLDSPVVTNVALATGNAGCATTSLYALTEDGQVHCVESRDGHRYWTYHLSKDPNAPPHRLWSSPALSVAADRYGQASRLYFGVTVESSSRIPMLCCLEDQLEPDAE